MKLIGATASPYVRKVRVVMAEKKLDYQFVQENVWADDTAIAGSNPLGKVPCLVMEGGEFGGVTAVERRKGGNGGQAHGRRL